MHTKHVTHSNWKTDKSFSNECVTIHGLNIYCASSLHHTWGHITGERISLPTKPSLYHRLLLKHLQKLLRPST